jgi:hypothetical protein
VNEQKFSSFSNLLFTLFDNLIVHFNLNDTALTDIPYKVGSLKWDQQSETDSGFIFYSFVKVEQLVSLTLLLGPFRVLVGTGRACFETLRPLAYSLLAEIVHHVRGDLSLAQVLLF